MYKYGTYKKKDHLSMQYNETDKILFLVYIFDSFFYVNYFLKLSQQCFSTEE